MRTVWKTIARVAKTHARSGEVVVEQVHGLPPLLHAGMEVALVPPALKTSRYHEVVRASAQGAGQLVRFSGASSLDEAASLVGRMVLARADDLPDTIDLLDKDALIGSAVFDAARGYLGELVQIMAGPTQDVWAIRTDAGELLVPVLPAFVARMDEDGVLLELPEGVLPAMGEV